MTAWWRQVYDAAERAVAPHVDAVVRSDEFARAAAVVTQAQATLQRQLAERTAQLWHMVNLPAGTDVDRLRASIGALDREVRRLAACLEEQGRDDAAGPDGPAGQAPRRGGSQRGPRP